MKKFQFGLEAVQRLRGAAEKEAMADLARALGTVRVLEATMTSIEDRRCSLLEVVETRFGTGELDVTWLERHHADLARLDGEEQRARVALVAARSSYEQAQGRLRDRRAERRAIDVLEDKARERHEEEFRRDEHLAMDEIAMQRHGRRSS